MRRFPTLALAALALLAACGDSQPFSLNPDARRAPRSEVRTGFIPGPGGLPMEVRFLVADGRGLLEGDIDLGPADAIARTRAELVARSAGASEGGARRGVIIRPSQYYWPGGDVPYVIDASLPNQARVTNAIAYIEGRAPGINYFPRTGQSDYVRIVPSANPDDCRANIGRSYGEQRVWLGANCGTGTAIHELLHTAGLWHEHSRCDRDSVVTILLDNVESEELKPAFDKHCTDGLSNGFYNEASIMHYPYNAFGKRDANGMRMQTIVSLRNREWMMGQQDSMTSSDVFSVHYMYPPPQLRARIVGPGTTVRVGNTYQWTSDVYENGPANSYKWYRDRVLVSQAWNYYGTVSSLSQFELMLTVTNAAGETATTVTYVYPSP